MPFIRLSDNYIDHPKFRALSDGSFRLWHEAMAFARRHQTDGLITFRDLKAFEYFTRSREKQLSVPYADGANPLWELVPATGYKIHDYLDWNPSKEEENERRAESKERMRQLRERRQSPGTPPVTAFVTPSPPPVTRSFVLDRIESGSGSSLRNDEDELCERAGRLREDLYPAWFAKYRNGARLRLVANSLEFQDALSLVRTWDDARLEKLAKIVLTTDESFIATTDRSFKIFALKASWADDRLRQWETTNGVAV
jgi:hypothetical protein